MLTAGWAHYTLVLAWCRWRYLVIFNSLASKYNRTYDRHFQPMANESLIKWLIDIEITYQTVRNNFAFLNANLMTSSTLIIVTRYDEWVNTLSFKRQIDAIRRFHQIALFNGVFGVVFDTDEQQWEFRVCSTTFSAIFAYSTDSTRINWCGHTLISKQSTSFRWFSFAAKSSHRVKQITQTRETMPTTVGRDWIAWCSLCSTIFNMDPCIHCKFVTVSLVRGLQRIQKNVFDCIRE